MTQTFFIRSTELRDYTRKHHCAVLETIRGETGREKLLVEVDPPIPGHLYGRREDLELLVVAPRHDGTTLLPEVSEWPCRVYMLAPAEGGSWSAGPYENLDWGVLERE